MSAEQTPDIETVLAEHRINYHTRNIGGETSESLRYTSCEGCDWKGGWHDEAGWEAHVAQALAPVLAAAEGCWQPCDQDCEVGPIHCEAVHLPSHKAKTVLHTADCLAAAVREAKAEALQEVANELGPGPTMRWLYERESCDLWGDRPVRDWLRERADRVAEPQHEAATSSKESEASDE